jgi:hypothetical protein
MKEEEYINEFRNLDKDNDREMVTFASKVQNDFIAKKINKPQLENILDNTICTLSEQKRDYIADAILDEEE